MYQIRPEDKACIEEFRKTPIGHHSPNLQRILNLFRGEPMAGKFALICTRPHREWTLAVLSGTRGERIRMTEEVFHSLEEAEWYVFKQRWAKYTGEHLSD
jgi:branched-chain amino acid transport system permease protein